MPEAVEELIFESKIKAKIDASSANTTLTNLDRKISGLAGKISGYFRDIGNIVSVTERNAGILLQSTSDLQKASNNIASYVESTALVVESVAIQVRNANTVIGEMNTKLAEWEQRKKNLSGLTNEEVEALKKEISTLDSSLGYQQRRVWSLEDQIEKQKEFTQSVEESHKAVSKQVDELRAKVKNYEYIIDELRRKSHEHMTRDEAEANKLAKAMGQFTMSMRGVVKDYTDAIVMSGNKAGTFQKKYEGAAMSVRDSLVSVFEEMAKAPITDHIDKIIEVVDRMAEQQGKLKGRTGEDLKAIVQAWHDLFMALVGRSIITDLVGLIEYYLVERMEKILGDSARIIKTRLLTPLSEETPKKIIKAYSDVMEEMRKENKKVKAGLIESARDVEQILDDITGYAEEPEYWLRAYREFVLDWSKFASLEKVNDRMLADARNMNEIIDDLKNRILEAEQTAARAQQVAASASESAFDEVGRKIKLAEITADGFIQFLWHDVLGFMDVLDKVDDRVVGFAEKIADPKTWKNASDRVEGFIDSIGDTVDYILLAKIPNTFSRIEYVIDEFGAAIDRTMQETIPRATDSFEKFIDQIGEAFGTVIEAFPVVLADFPDAIGEVFRESYEYVKSFATGSVTQLEKFIDQFGEAFGTIIKAFPVVLADFPDAVEEVLRESYDYIKSFSKDTMRTIKSMASAIPSAFRVASTAVQTTVANILGSDFVTTVTDKTLAAMAEFGGAILDKFPLSVINAVKTTATGIGGLQDMFRDAGIALYVALNGVFRRPPIETLRILRDGFKPIVDDLAQVGKDAGTKLLDRVKEAITLDLPIIARKMGDIGKQAADAMVNAMQQGATSIGPVIVSGIAGASHAVINAATNLGERAAQAIVNRFKYAAGAIGDILTFKKPVERAASAYERALRLGLEKTAKAIRDESVRQGGPYLDVFNTLEDSLDYTMQNVRTGSREAFGEIIQTLKNASTGTLEFRDVMAGLGVGFRDLWHSIDEFSDRSKSANRDLVRAVKNIDKMLLGYREEGKETDKALRRMGENARILVNTLKNQGTVYVNIVQARRREMEKEGEAWDKLSDQIGKYAVNLERIAKGERVDMDATIRGIDEATKALRDLGAAPEELDESFIASMQVMAEYIAKAKRFLEVSDRAAARGADIPEASLRAYQAARDNLNAFTDSFDTMSDRIEDITDVVAAVEDEFKKGQEELGEYNVKLISNFQTLDTESKKIAQIYSKRYSLINRAIEDYVTNLKHWLTDVEATGKVSEQRLSDLAYALKQFRDNVAELRKQRGLQIPGLDDKYWNNLIQNAAKLAERQLLLAQRATVVNKRHERMAEAGKKVAASFKGMGKAAITHLPFIGKKSKEAEESIKRLDEISRQSTESTSMISFALDSLDPVFSTVADGAGQMGMVFGNAMDSMAEVAKVKGAAVISTLTAIKLATAGILAVFSGLIISTGMVAAEVTTLTITMDTVARNVGYNVDAVHALREELRGAGIDIKEATQGLTAFMRAKLPMSWKDPIDNITYSIQDLADAAKEVAVTVGEDSSATFQRFIEFINTGNSQLLNQVAIMKNANQFYKEYADAIGTTADKLSDYQQRMALATGLMREAATVTGVYDEAMKSAAKQLGSMRRYWFELRYEWGKYFEPVLAIIIFRFNELLQILTDVPERTKEAIAQFVVIATAISGIVVGLTTLLPIAKKVMGFLGPAFGLLTGKTGLLLAVVGLLAQRLGKMFMDIDVESEGIQGLVDRVDILLDRFGGLRKTLEPITKWLKSFFNMVSRRIRDITSKMDEIIRGIISRIDELRAKYPEFFSFLERAKKVIGDLFTTIWRVVYLAFDAIEALLNQDWDKFYSRIKLIGKYIVAWMTEFLFEVIVDAYNWGKYIIESFVSGILDWGKVFIPRAMVQIGTIISAFLEGHSPAKVGPLSKIGFWGIGLMEEFERGLRSKGIAFDEGMFEGFTSLRSKAKAWGDNIIDVFTYGISSRALKSIGPAMDFVGGIIARFLEGHSPPEAGRLSEIENWGRNAFETFLAAFELADFSILDRALDLVRRRLQLLVGSAQDGAQQIAQSMMQIREAVAGAIFEARTTGGPLNLGALRELILGSITLYAQDVAAVMEAMFDALIAREAYEEVQKQIEELEKQKETLTARMEEQIEMQVRAMGLMVDEGLMEELQRQLEEANLQVSRAQRRLAAVQGSAAKYGMNVLTWEEINAQAQLELAERRQAEVQEEINLQEQIRREAERVRAEIEAQYETQLAAIESQIETTQLQAEELQEIAEAAQEHADLLSALLEARLEAEEEVAKGIEQSTGATSKLDEVVDGINEGLDNFLTGLDGVREKIEGWMPGIPSPPTFSELWEKYFGGVGEALEGGLPGLIEGLREKISTWWGEFKTTGIGQVLEQIGAISLVETVSEELAEIVEHFEHFREGIAWTISLFESLNEKMREAIGIDIGGLLGGAFRIFVIAPLEILVVTISELIQMIMDTAVILPRLFSGEGWEAFKPLLEDIVGWLIKIGEILAEAVVSIADPISQALGLGEITLDTVADNFIWLFETIIDWCKDVIAWFAGLALQIGGALSGLWDAVVGIWESIRDFLIGNSLIPDLIAGIVGWIGSIPEKLLGFATSIFNAAVKLGTQIYNGIKQGIDNIINNVASWFGNIVSNFSAVEVIENFYNKALEVATGILTAFKDMIFAEDTGLLDKVKSWLKGVAESLGMIGGTLWTSFKEMGGNIGNAIIDKIKEIVEGAKTTIGDALKSLWNQGLQPRFQRIVDGVTAGLNKIRDILATVWNAVASFVPGMGPFPIPVLVAPLVPTMQAGGIVFSDMIAQLHAGEIVMPLDKLDQVLNRVIGGGRPLPAFQPVLNFYPGSSPQQIMPAVRDSYDWYVEEQRRG